MNKFSQDIEQVLLPLKEFLDFDLIKSEDELMLTYAIIIKDILVQNPQNSKNRGREFDNLEKAKTEIICWIELIKSRDNCSNFNDYEDLITELYKLNFIKRKTIDEISCEKILRLLYPMYRSLNDKTNRSIKMTEEQYKQEIDRLMEIANQLSQWMKHTSLQANKARQMILSKENEWEEDKEWEKELEKVYPVFNKWGRSIDKHFHTKALELYNRLEPFEE